MRRLVGLGLVALVVCVPPGVLAERSSPQRPAELRVESGEGSHRLWVEMPGSRGETRRTLLRRTASSPTPSRTGSDPAGTAWFATWMEAGEPWSAYSLDGGANWKPARASSVALRLREASVAPFAPMPAARAGLTLPPGGRVFLVQFHTVSLPAWRRALTETGAEILSFFPHNAHLVRLGPGQLAAVRALEFVRRVEPYHPSYRLEVPLREWLEASAPAGERVRVRVAAFEWGPAGKSRILRDAGALGAKAAAYWPSGHVIELVVDREQLRAVAAHDDVMWIERWTPSENDMDLVREDAGTNWIESLDGSCGQGVRGEVLDNGIQEDHPDFDGILLHGPHDVESHGTSTYGIVFGNGDRDGDGDAQGTGHLPCAEQGIFADYETLADRFAHTQELKAAPYFASFQSNSWGSARDLQYTLAAFEMDDIIWRLDIAITQSQSNAGNQQSRPQAWAKNVISVGGIKHMDTLSTADDTWCAGGGSCASIGPAADGRIKPDLNYWYDEIYTTTTGSGYRTDFGGTSGATPEVAGVLGLMLQMWSDNVWGTNPVGTTVFERQPHFSTLKALLINNAEQYPFSGTGHDLTRVHQGWGRPNAQLARERAASSFVIDEQVPLPIATPVAYDIDVQPGEAELKVTMVFPDPPGVTSAGLHRVNDVNLRVTSPGGAVYHGNVGLDAGTESVPGGAPNGIDTVENVFVVTPQPGLWRVEIEAVEVNQDAHLATPEDDVTFALVVTGGSGAVCPGAVADFTTTPNPARVGESVAFDSTVTGGAGGPYAYAWDFEIDGVTDSIDDDTSHVYRRPYSGEVKLVVRDGGDCPVTERRTLDVTGPDLRYDGFIDLIEVDGNGNGGVDPGEVFDLRIVLRNDGNEDALGVSAEIAAAPGNPGTLVVLQQASSFPDVLQGGTSSSAASYRFTVGQDFVCGEDAVFSVRAIATTDPPNVYPDETGVLRVLVGGTGPPQQFFFDGFETPGGWTGSPDGEWEFDAPQGLGGQSSIPGQIAKPDPQAAFEGSRVVGTDLTGLGQFAGNYETDVSTTLISPIIDASDAVDVELQIARWLNTEVNDASFIEISNDGSNWTRLFDDPGGFTESSWSDLSYDVSAVADNRPIFLVRFGLTADAVGVQGGWNIDAVRAVGVLRESCVPFSSSLPGEARSLRLGKGAPGDLQLVWGADCGGASSYSIYRGDLGAGYGSIAQEPGRCAVGGTAATLPEGSGAADFFIVVPNDGAAEGSYGADSNLGPRAPAPAACLPQGPVAACAP